MDVDPPTALHRQHQQFLGDPATAMPEFGAIELDDNELLPEGVTVEHLAVFERMYREHCEVSRLHFVCLCFISFRRPPSPFYYR